MKKESSAKEISSGQAPRKRAYESPRLTEIGRAGTGTAGVYNITG